MPAVTLAEAKRKGVCAFGYHVPSCPDHKPRHQKTYAAWTSMRTRCRNPKDARWKYYGGRGITVCERWETYENFLEDMGEAPEGLTLDRIDNNGNYESDNCRWATRKVQDENKRHCPTCHCPIQMRLRE